MIIDIEPHSGFCSGVKRVVKLAESELQEGKKLECLGEIVHNQAEVNRLEEKGMETIDLKDLEHIHDSIILIRAHGEPVSTYENLNQGNHKIIDGTCPVVLRVQKKVREAYEQSRTDGGKIIIYGKPTHPEVIGLLGQISNDALAVTHTKELEAVLFEGPIYLFSQTTMPMEGFKDMENYIRNRLQQHYKPGTEPLHLFDTICRQVANRVPQLEAFARNYEVIIFVGGAKSSNGKVLFQACLNQNKNCFFVSEKSALHKEWFEGIQTVGICGATSTPFWQMEEVKHEIIEISKKNNLN